MSLTLQIVKLIQFGNFEFREWCTPGADLQGNFPLFYRHACKFNLPKRFVRFPLFGSVPLLLCSPVFRHPRGGGGGELTQFYLDAPSNYKKQGKNIPKIICFCETVWHPDFLCRLLEYHRCGTSLFCLKHNGREAIKRTQHFNNYFKVLSHIYLLKF